MAPKLLGHLGVPSEIVLFGGEDKMGPSLILLNF